MYLKSALKEADRNVKLLWCSALVRLGSYGMTNQILTLHLKQLGILENKIGVFMTLTLLGDTLLSYFLTWHADSIGRRAVMLAGSSLMVASGLVFSKFSNYYILLFAAIIGVISPSGDETGPFKSIEEAAIAHLTPSAYQPEVFAFHSLFATSGAALGSILTGFIVDYFNLKRNLSLEQSYRVIFAIYSGLGLIKVLLACVLSGNVEYTFEEENDRLLQEDVIESNDREQETSDIVGENLSKLLLTRLLGLSNETGQIVTRLLLVFMLDSLGYGFMPTAWVVYYFKRYFLVSATSLGILFFLTNVIDGVSSFPSAYLAKKLGPVKAMLFTQIPSSFFFILIGLSKNFWLAATLVILYYSTTTMDVVPRQFLLTSLIPSKELTRVMGLVNISKTYARCIGPVITGRLAERKKLYLGFFLNGGSVLLADFILGINFLHYDSKVMAKAERH